MVLSACFVVGCNEDKKEVPDPAGTMSLSMNAFNRVWATDLYWVSSDRYFTRIGTDNNFYCYVDYFQQTQEHQVINVGKVNGLGSIKKIPSSGCVTITAVEPGNGYVFKISDTYARLYVVEWMISTSGGIIGTKVKYQYPFNP